MLIYLFPRPFSSSRLKGETIEFLMMPQETCAPCPDRTSLHLPLLLPYIGYLRLFYIVHTKPEPCYTRNFNSHFSHFFSHFFQASVSEVVLSVRASRLIIFEAGPKPWPLVPARFYSNIHTIDSEEVWEGLEVETVSQSEPRKGQQHAFRVTCLALGEQVGLEVEQDTFLCHCAIVLLLSYYHQHLCYMCVSVQWLVFTSGNTPGPLNEQPSKEESRVKVACSSPASLSLSLLPFSPSSSSFSSSILSSFQPKACPQSQHPTSMVSFFIHFNFLCSFLSLPPVASVIPLSAYHTMHS